MKLNKITDHCWYTDSDPSTDRPSLGYILGSNGMAVAVDSGNSRKHYREYLSLLDEAGLPHPSFCILTHWHWDHTLGIKEVGCPVFACEKTQKHLMDLKNMSAEDLQAMYSANEFLQAEYSDPAFIEPGTADITFDRSVMFDLGDITVNAIHINGPHSDDSVIVYIGEDGMIFAGDSSAGNFDLPNIAYDQDLLKEYTDFILGLEFNVFLHQHRAPLNCEETEKFLALAKERGYYTFD